ncbi:MAG: phosphotransferase family protein [Deltaproteobacteria bacterium]|nr:phosphotransferase family protein [Deltaproteobacteria bacterium]
MSDLAERFAAYAARKLDGAREVRVSGLDRIPGGASRETYRLVLHYEQHGRAHERRLILRRDPPGSLIDTERRLEFAAYAAFWNTAVPVPEAIWLEEDPAHLDYAFCVMQELAGFEASPAMLLAPPYAEHREKIGAQKWQILGEIAKADPNKLGLVGVMKDVAPAECWQRELGYWEGVIDEDELEPQPIMRAVIRWLRNNPPPPAQKISVVHGDYRTGNFLYDTAGDIHAILDWEMAHLGDPLEDLAWGLNPVWMWARDGRAGGLLPRAHAIRTWESASGLRADPAALQWWELFSCVKGQGIWVSSAREYQTGKNQDPILAISGYLMTNAQDRAALHLLGRLT